MNLCCSPNSRCSRLRSDELSRERLWANEIADLFSICYYHAADQPMARGRHYLALSEFVSSF